MNVSAAMANTKIPPKAPKAPIEILRRVIPFNNDPSNMMAAPTPKAASEARDTVSTTVKPADAKAIK
jgi:hypothetical protein